MSHRFVESLERRVACSAGAAAWSPPSAAPDLAATRFELSGLPSTVFGGQIGAATVGVANVGNTIALGPVQFTIYAAPGSGAADLSAATPIASFMRSIRLRPGASRTVHDRFTISAEPAAATYQLVAVVNSSHALAESDFGNNTVAGPTVAFSNPVADVAVRFGRAAPLIVTAGRVTRVLVAVANRGAVTVAGTVAVDLYASPDAALNPGDPQLTAAAVPVRLKASMVRAVRLAFKLPTDFPGGDYFLIAAIHPAIVPPDGTTSDDVAVSPTGTLIRSTFVPPEQLFADNFNLPVTDGSQDTLNLDLSQRQLGPLAPLTYTRANDPSFSQVNDPRSPDALLLTGISGGPWGGVSPDHNFVEPPGGGDAQIIEFDVNPCAGNDPSQNFTQTSWVCIDFGASASGRNQFPQFTDGIGLLFRGDGRTQAFDDHQHVGDGRFAPGIDNQFHHIRIEITDPAGGNPFAGNGSPAQVRAFADGSTVPFFQHTVQGGFSSNYISFVAEGEGGPGGAVVHHAIENFAVQSGPPTPAS